MNILYYLYGVEQLNMLLQFFLNFSWHIWCVFDSGASTSYRYYMTVSPTDGKLYLTDFQNKQVLRVKETQPENLPNDITTNFEIIAGRLTNSQQG